MWYVLMRLNGRFKRGQIAATFVSYLLDDNWKQK
jgi:hypothetical protein